MKKLLKPIAILGLLLAAAAAGAYIYLQQQFRIPHAPGPAPVVIEIPRGSRTRAVVQLLREHNIIKDEYVAYAYLALTGSRGRLQAGEYMFDAPLTIAGVFDKIVNGRVYLHKFTVPEGLTLQETSLRWEDQGFGPAQGFRTAATDSVKLIHDLDPAADSLEGYLFPETYMFPIRTTPAQAVAAMIARFRDVVGKLHPANLHDTVILASIVESEAAHDDERATIASVYSNRLKKNMLLQCDTTVIYALERENKYRGSLTLKDLRFESSYNTYVHPGLPPGAIMNPGYNSIAAAVQPAVTNFIYFVRTSGGRHTFSETLAEHNRAVAHYRELQGR